MRIAVMGAGAVGGYFGAKLSASGHNAAFLARGATSMLCAGKAFESTAQAAICVFTYATPFTNDPNEVAHGSHPFLR